LTAYLVADITITDAAAFDEYRAKVPETIERAGGRYLVRGGDPEPAEGGWEPTRITILEFPSMAALRAWYDGDEYRPLKALRDRGADARIVFVEGV
jgi:uncharacterized protein (DUF1330 family)